MPIEPSDPSQLHNHPITKSSLPPIEDDPIERIAESVPQVKELTPDVLAELKEQIKSEMMDEFKSEQSKEAELTEARRQQDDAAWDLYATNMKESADPWVDIQGIVRDPTLGIKIKLDWNDAFIKELRDNGYTGITDDDIIHKYVALLAADMASVMEEDTKFEERTDSEYE